MNIRKHQELLDFWEYSHNFDSEDGAVSIDEGILPLMKHSRNYKLN